MGRLLGMQGGLVMYKLTEIKKKYSFKICVHSYAYIYR